MKELENILRELYKPMKDFGECYALYEKLLKKCEEIHMERCEEIREEENGKHIR